MTKDKIEIKVEPYWNVNLIFFIRSIAFTLINKILSEKFDASIKRVQRIISELGLKSVIVKKFKHHTTKIKIDDKDNILNQDFSTNTINEK